MYTLGARRILKKKCLIIVCLLNLMAWKASWAHRTCENGKKDHDKIKKKSVQTSSACGPINIALSAITCRIFALDLLYIIATSLFCISISIHLVRQILFMWITLETLTYSI